MRTRDVTKALLVIAVAASPWAASARMSARAGVLYSRLDVMPAAGGRSTMPHFDLDLALDTSGFVYSPDLLNYDASVGYRRLSDEVNGARTSQTTSLTYGARVGLLQNVASPIHLELFANRGEADFATSADSNVFGRGIGESAGVSMRLDNPALPALSGTYTWSKMTDHIPTLEPHEFTTQTITSNVNLGTPAYHLAANYTGSFTDGTWEAERASAHEVVVSGSAPIGGVATIGLQTQASYTIPNALVTGAFEQQSSNVSVFVSSLGGPGARRVGSYGYSHTLTASNAGPTNELTRQGLRYQGDHLLTSPTLFTRFLVDASMSEARSGDNEARSTGETLGAELWWRRLAGASRLEINAGPRVGLIQTEGGNAGGLGAIAGVKLTRPLGGRSLSGAWNGSYSQNLYGTVGWQFSQSASASLNGLAGMWRYSASGQVSAFRTHHPVIGDGAGRTLQLTGTTATKRLGFGANLGYAEGMVGASQKGFISDGLLLPAPFDSRTITAGAGVGYLLYPALHTRFHFRYAQIDVPGRPIIHELEAVAGLSYSFAAFSVSLEDRITRFEATDGWDTTNMFFVSVSRGFSW